MRAGSQAHTPMPKVLSFTALKQMLGDPVSAEQYSAAAGDVCLVVDLAGADTTPLVQPALPVIGVLAAKDGVIPDVVDLVVDTEGDLASACDAAAANPLAASVLVQLLRHNESASVADGLFAESLAYSTLQHGTEFKRWLAERVSRAPVPDLEEAVLLNREGDQLTISLNRPHKRNAYSAGLRDALCAALHVPLLDNSISEVLLRGNGAAFSAGGDLDEFGLARDAAVAHLSRTTRSAANLLSQLSERVTARVHGACIGAGIELPAYATQVSAAPNAFFQLPEVAMGLIPGAGGTVSVTRRIGRRRTAWFALSNQRVDAPTALEWGLIDRIEDDPPNT